MKVRREVRGQWRRLEGETPPTQDSQEGFHCLKVVCPPYTHPLGWELGFNVAVLILPALGCGLLLDFFSLLSLFETL